MTRIYRTLSAALAAAPLIAATGCGKSNTPPPDAGTAINLVGPAGGTVTGPDGLLIYVPKNSLTGNVTFTISASDNVAPPPNVTVVSHIYEVDTTPASPTFSIPPTIELPFDPSKLGGLPIGNLANYTETTNGTANDWTSLLSISFQDAHTVSSEVQQFGRFVAAVQATQVASTSTVGSISSSSSSSSSSNSSSSSSGSSGSISTSSSSVSSGSSSGSGSSGSSSSSSGSGSGSTSASTSTSTSASASTTSSASTASSGSTSSSASTSSSGSGSAGSTGSTASTNSSGSTVGSTGSSASTGTANSTGSSGGSSGSTGSTGSNPNSLTGDLAFPVHSATWASSGGVLTLEDSDQHCQSGSSEVTTQTLVATFGTNVPVANQTYAVIDGGFTLSVSQAFPDGGNHAFGATDGTLTFSSVDSLGNAAGNLSVVFTPTDGGAADSIAGTFGAPICLP